MALVPLPNLAQPGLKDMPVREYESPLLANLTTIRLGGPAIAKIVIESEDDLEMLPERLKYWGGDPFCLGRGSNLLASDDQLPFTLVQMNNAEVEIVGEKAGKILVQVGAGLPLAKLLTFCHKNGLSGLEGLIGIPGTVGGATAMNAGSFGSETANCIHSAILWEKDRKKQYYRNEISCSYRRMSFGNNEWGIIVKIFFALTHSPNNVIFERMNHNFFEKKSRQPLAAWSAGCAFKNPPGVSAGLLLDKAGFRGRKLGGMAFSEKHANFLINEGNGTSDAAFELLELAKMKVREKFGLELEPEVRILK